MANPKDDWVADGTSEPPSEATDGADAVNLDDLPPPPGATGEGPEDDLLAEALAFAETADATGDPGAPGDVAAERDEYRDALLRVKADFDNYKKRIAKDHAATVERAAEKLVADLLPVLDACEAALGHGATDVEPIYKSLLDVLEKGGLVRMAAEGQPFDPNLHEAVMHEPGDGDEIVVLDSLRTGYLWNGRVVRPAMVKVRG